MDTTILELFMSLHDENSPAYVEKQSKTVDDFIGCFWPFLAVFLPILDILPHTQNIL